MSALSAYLLQTLVTLLGVVGLAVVLLWSARKLGLGKAQGPMRLLGRLPLEPKRTLYLVRIGGRVLVLGASEAGLRRLAQLRPEELQAVAPEPEGKSFAQVLSKLRKDKAAAHAD